MGISLIRALTPVRPLIRRTLAVGAAILAIALAGPVYKLGIVLGLWQPATRPASVSESAHYVSLVEDGTWFDCRVDSKRNVDVCRAWDANGKLIAAGDFRLEGENRAAEKSELHPSWVATSDGRAYMIYLFGKHGAFTSALVPVGQKQGPGEPR